MVSVFEDCGRQGAVGTGAGYLFRPGTALHYPLGLRALLGTVVIIGVRLSLAIAVFKAVWSHVDFCRLKPERERVLWRDGEQDGELN